MRLGQARGPSGAATCLTFILQMLKKSCTKWIGRGGGFDKSFLRKLPGAMHDLMSVRLVKVFVC